MSKIWTIIRSAITSKRYEIGCHLVYIINRKLHTGFRLVPTSVTLNDLERNNSPYFVFFSRNWIALGLAANPIANATSFNATMVCSWKRIFQGGNLFEGMSRKNVWGNCQAGKYPWEKRLGRNDRIPRMITSLYVQWLWFVIPWLTYWHRDTQSGRLTDRHLDSFWPVILLAEPA